jgi:acyl-CoA thioester hydrolase
MRLLPSYDQVLGLPSGPRAPVPEAYADSNGHLNVRHHLALYDDAEWAIYEPVDLGEAHALAGLGGVFALEQHVTYRREVLVGEDVAVHVRLLARAERLLHLVSYLVNHSRREVAGSLEALEGYVDLHTRRLAPIPAPAAAALDTMVADAEALGWRPELSGSMTLVGTA